MIESPMTKHGFDSTGETKALLQEALELRKIFSSIADKAT